MPVFRYKGIKVVTDANDLQEVMGRLPKARQTLEQLKREIGELPAGVYRRRNPGLGFEVSVIGGTDQIDILGVPPPKPVPPELARVELIPQFKFAPAFYAISEATGEYVGVVLARGAGWGPPYFLLELDSMGVLYDPRYQNFASYSDFSTGRDDGPWFRYPEGDMWDEFREGKSRFLGVEPSTKAIGDPPALVVPWEIPARGEYVADTGWIDADFQWRGSYSTCSVFQTYPYNCDTGGAMHVRLGNQAYWAERPILYQTREIPAVIVDPDFPCGETIVGLPQGRARTDQAEIQWRWTCEWVVFCILYPCGGGDCYKPTVCGIHMALIADALAYCTGVCGQHMTWAGGSQHNWNNYLSYEYVYSYTFTTVFSPWYGSVLLNESEGGILYYTMEFVSTSHRWKEFVPIYNQCFHVTNNLSGGSEKSTPTSDTTEKEESIWCDEENYPTGYSTYGDFEYSSKIYAGYYKLPTGSGGTEETVFLLSVQRRKAEWERWSFYHLAPDRKENPLLVEEFDFFSFGGDPRKFIIPGITYKNARLIGDGRYTMVAYLEQALQDDIKEVF
jgi:hypothetical protein